MPEDEWTKHILPIFRDVENVGVEFREASDQLTAEDDFTTFF